MLECGVLSLPLLALNLCHTHGNWGGEWSSYSCQPKIELPQHEAESLEREMLAAFPSLHPQGETTALQLGTDGKGAPCSGLYLPRVNHL